MSYGVKQIVFSFVSVFSFLDFVFGLCGPCESVK
jgi:hypothetical protein